MTASGADSAPLGNSQEIFSCEMTNLLGKALAPLDEFSEFPFWEILFGH